MVQGTCKLCLQVKPLVKSHILPEWGYKWHYDPKFHRAYLLSAEPDRMGKAYSGVWEHLLCEQCDGKLSPYEQYARDLLTDPARLTIPPPRRYLPNRADYHRF